MPSLLSLNSYHYLRGGSETVYFNHARLFEAHGWSSSFMSMHHPENIPCEDDAYFADNIDYGGGSGQRSLGNALKIIYSLEAQRKIAALLDRKPADIAHVHSIYHHLSPSVLVELKKRGVPIVLTAHDLKLACPNNKMLTHDGVCERCKGGKIWNVAVHRCIKDSLPASAVIMVESAVHKALRLYANTVSKIIAPSRFYRAKLIEWGWPAEQIVFIPNFVELDGVQAAEPGGDYLLYFGRLAQEKGLLTLVRAAAASKVPVKLVGRGPQEEALRALIAELNAPVELLGFRSGEDLWAAVGGAKAIVLPSEWYENGPMSVIEAFARGKPLVGADIGGIPELTDSGAAGWLFKSGDVADLAQTLSTVWTSSTDTLRGMGAACRERAFKDYSADVYFGAMSSIYGDLMGRRTVQAGSVAAAAEPREI